jgi:hypothetical protein
VTGTNISVGGFAVAPPKMRKGAKFILPSPPTVDTHAISRGTSARIIH